MAETDHGAKHDVPLSSMTRALVSRRSQRSLHSNFRSNRSARDVEVQSTNGQVLFDPLGLTPLIKAESEISTIKTEKKKSGLHVRFHPEKRVKEFYEGQNEEIRSFLKSVEDHQQDIDDTQEAAGLAYQIAVKGSLCANVALSGLQLYAAISSGSRECSPNFGTTNLQFGRRSLLTTQLSLSHNHNGGLLLRSFLRAIAFHGAQNRCESQSRQISCWASTDFHGWKHLLFLHHVYCVHSHPGAGSTEFHRGTDCRD